MHRPWATRSAVASKLEIWAVGGEVVKVEAFLVVIG